MDVSEFQKKLNEICALAEDHNKKLTAFEVKEFFEGADFQKEQLLKILQYLKLKGITIEGAEGAQAAQNMEETETEESNGTKIPLTPEEQEYLKAYLKELEGTDGNGRTENELFAAVSSGDALARKELTNRYLRLAAEMAAEMNCEEIFLADLIQEANISLLMALDEPEPAAKNGEWLKKRIRQGIIQAIEEQTQRKFQDDYLVAKVEKLESAVKELTEDEEDDKNKFSIDELAVILDMDVEEIRDVLRLTGDDK